ncbi:DNA-3-methyladenine glycosylase II [Planktotalea frisia]|uniref:DNA-3-methyladenine glycosylase II n=1 Tax=Planktotalea frisia TaxID=696762 RepID=A0A1L9NYZ8_9RHOB|nr:DNA-3-methyladenine glycosylase [Planktotalea frisia]OJI94423.1 DNA-3-methyladenine glycosylase [Planktotalea frisia]PZX30071.1 DNA-3-methyladenine glycosylase II [Planktotalea frisia]
MDERVILGDTCVLEGAEWLAGYDARFAAAMAQTGPLPLRLKPEGFDQLLNAIIGQQVSVASANAIWARMVALDLTSEDTIARASDEDLRAAGLSQQKMRYARALAEARIDYDALREMPSDAVIKTLTQVTGIGQWTAEIYAMFSLGRADVFAHGDLALQEAARVLLDLEERPKEKQMKIIAADWSPWRSVAARVLWAYYRVVKSREGIR